MKLLVAIDDGPHAQDALELARVLCTATGSSALVVHVLFAGPLPMESALLPEEEASEAGALFVAAREALSGVEVETRAYGGGSPAAIVTDISEKEDLDGIVIGSPRRHGLGRVLSGSVAIGILNGAQTDVFIAPPGYAEVAHDGLDTVAVGYLGTPDSKVALRRALDLVGPAGRLEVLVVAEPPVPLSLAGEDLPNPIDPDRILAEALEAVPAEVRLEGRRLDGPAAPELEKACAEGVDLLALGSRGYGPLKRVLLGSVSGHLVRHAPCPVLVTRRA
ncbi:MAG TPA: universal stress protein [Solirubrobacterales bacterium]|nr:universal stress protein [Solirubrobacterales bacterium]